jgi:hypothetical protein
MVSDIGVDNRLAPARVCYPDIVQKSAPSYGGFASRLRVCGCFGFA